MASNEKHLLVCKRRRLCTNRVTTTQWDVSDTHRSQVTGDEDAQPELVKMEIRVETNYISIFRQKMA